MEKRSYKVFISHALKDSRLARRLAKEIEAAGASVFLDERGLTAGEPISTQIDKALRSSDEVVVLVTPHSRESPWLGFEAGAALGLGKRVVPVIEGLRRGDLPPALLSLQSVEAKDLSHYVAELGRRVAGAAS